MKRTQKTSAFLAIIMLLSGLAVLVIPASLSASTLIHLYESGVGNFDELYATSADPIFATPGFSDFTDAVYNPVAGWSGAFTSANAIGASGVTRTELLFAMSFDDAFVATPFNFEFYSYESGVTRDWATIYYNGQGITDWNYDNWTIVTHQLPTVPEPSTLFLLGSGLVGLAGFVRRSGTR
jgi:hypothetical protein